MSLKSIAILCILAINILDSITVVEGRRRYGMRRCRPKGSKFSSGVETGRQGLPGQASGHEDRYTWGGYKDTDTQTWRDDSGTHTWTGDGDDAPGKNDDYYYDPENDGNDNGGDDSIPGIDDEDGGDDDEDDTQGHEGDNNGDDDIEGPGDYNHENDGDNEEEEGDDAEGPGDYNHGDDEDDEGDNTQGPEGDNDQDDEDSNPTTGGDNPTTSGRGQVYNLPLEEGFPNWDTNVKVTNPHRLSFDNGEMTIYYEADSHGSAGGVIMSGAPFGLFPANEMRLAAELYFPDDFPLINDRSEDAPSGGKLPLGLKIGQGAATGGQWSSNGATYRVMWRGDKKTGKVRAVPYIYYEIEGNEPDPSDQAEEFSQIADYTGGMGVNVFRHTDEALLLENGVWTAFEIYLKLNTPGEYDGLLEISVNGKKLYYDKMRWRLDDSQITGLAMDTFFGGGSSEWGPEHDTSLKVRNLRLIV